MKLPINEITEPPVFRQFAKQRGGEGVSVPRHSLASIAYPGRKLKENGYLGLARIEGEG